MHAPFISALFDISMSCCDHVNAASARMQCVMNLDENIFVFVLALILFFVRITVYFHTKII